MSLEVQENFTNYFATVQHEAVSSELFLSIKELFEKKLIDGATYGSLVLEYNRDTLQASLSFAFQIP